jgi:multidrug efflux pump subunit AcrB
MRPLFLFFVKNYKVTLTLTLFTLIAGVLGLVSLRRETYPAVNFAQVLVTTIYPGSSSQEVDERVTSKIEDELRTVDGLKQVSSVSQAGLSTIDIRIDADQFDNDQVVTEAQRAVQRVNGLPPDLLEQPNFVEIDTREIPVIELALIGPNDNRRRDELTDMIKERLEDIKGVSKVRLDGFFEREIHINMDPRKLAEQYVSVAQVVQAVSARLQNIPAGFVKNTTDETLVRLRGKLGKVDEFSDLVIRSNFSGERVRLRDVATVVDAYEDPRIMARANGQPATILTVLKRGEADSIATVDLLLARLEDIRSQLPSDFQLIKFTDEGSKIKDRLQIVSNNTLTGLVLVLVILIFFLPGIAGVVSSLSLPICVMGVTACMPLFGVTFNTITMLGIIIVVGMLVDNTIVITENYSQIRLRGVDPVTAATDAAHQFWIPITATVLTTIAAFLPMLVTKGVLGQFIRGIPIVVTVALVLCLFEAFFLLPMRLRFTLRNTPKSADSSAAQRRDWWTPVRERFESAMRWTVRMRYVTFVGLTLFLIGSIAFSVKFNRFELFPAEGVEMYIARYELPKGSSLEATDLESARLSNAITEIIGESNLSGVVGRAGTSYGGPGDPGGGNGNNIGGVVAYVPQDKARDLDSQDILNRTRAIPTGQLTALTFEAAANGPPVGKPVTIVFRSDNIEELRSFALRAQEFLAGLPGITDLRNDDESASDEYGLKVDYERLAKLGLSNEAVGLALRSALQGIIVSDINSNGKTVNVRARYHEKDRANLESVLRTQIQEPMTGKLIPLSAFASIEKTAGPPIIRHFDFRRAITVTANVIPETLTSMEANAKAAAFIDSIKRDFPSVTVKFGGEDESTRESFRSLLNAMLLALFGIAAILIFVFNSFAKPLLVITTIPLGLVGVSWAFYFHGRPLSFLALIGIVGLAGVVVNSAIVLVAYIDELRRGNRADEDLPGILARASADRLRAILATGLTTIGGLLPTAYGIGGYDAFLVPMVLALAWGLVAGTLLQLIWVPCAYAIGCDLGRLGSRLRKLIPSIVDS